MKKILFVCTGNTCRSSMAEGLFKFLIKKDTGLSENFDAFSGGIAAFDGNVASPHAVKALKNKWGIDINSHRSKRLNAETVKDSDLVLTMTRAQKEYIKKNIGCEPGKVFTLKEFTERNKKRKNEEYDYSLDIQDPAGLTYEIYEQCAMEIKNAIDELIKTLKQDLQ